MYADRAVALISAALAAATSPESTAASRRSARRAAAHRRRIRHCSATAALSSRLACRRASRSAAARARRSASSRASSVLLAIARFLHLRASSPRTLACSFMAALRLAICPRLESGAEGGGTTLGGALDMAEPPLPRFGAPRGSRDVGAAETARLSP